MTADPVEVLSMSLCCGHECLLPTRCVKRREDVRDALAALDAAGLVVVPRIPTENMLFTGLGMHDVETARGSDGLAIMARTYTAMLAGGPHFTWQPAATKPKP